MPGLEWRWLPIPLSIADLPRIVSEMCGSRLREVGGDDRTGDWAEYARVEVVRRVVSIWSAGSCTLTRRDDFHLHSERGEPPVELCVERARIDLPRNASLFVEGPYYRFEGPPAAVDAIERQWLAILKRDFFRPTWLDHPLVPVEWRLRAGDVSIGPTYNRMIPGVSGGHRTRPAVLLADEGTRSFGLLVDQAEALPLGPLPHETDVLLFEFRRPSGRSEMKISELFARLFDAARTVAETMHSAARLKAPLGFLTMRRTGQLEYVRFSSWRADRWILRSQYGVPYRSGPTVLSGDFDHQWAIQSEDGGAWAILAEGTQILSSQEETLAVRVVGEGNAASEVGGRLLSILADEGWTH